MIPGFGAGASQVTRNCSVVAVPDKTSTLLGLSLTRQFAARPASPRRWVPGETLVTLRVAFAPMGLRSVPSRVRVNPSGSVPAPVVDTVATILPVVARQVTAKL